MLNIIHYIGNELIQPRSQFGLVSIIHHPSRRKLLKWDTRRKPKGSKGESHRPARRAGELSGEIPRRAISGPRVQISTGQLCSEITDTRNRRQAWSLSNRRQRLAHGVAKSLQPSPLDYRFRSGMKYGNPRQSSSGMMIRNPIAVLHLVALCADDCRHRNKWQR